MAEPRHRMQIVMGPRQVGKSTEVKSSRADDLSGFEKFKNLYAAPDYGGFYRRTGRASAGRFLQP